MMKRSEIEHTKFSSRRRSSSSSAGLMHGGMLNSYWVRLRFTTFCCSQFRAQTHTRLSVFFGTEFLLMRFISVSFFPGRASTPKSFSRDSVDFWRTKRNNKFKASELIQLRKESVGRESKNCNGNARMSN